MKKTVLILGLIAVVSALYVCIRLARGQEPAQVFGKKIVSVLESKDIDGLMNLIDGNITCYDGSDYEDIKTKMDALFSKVSSVKAKLLKTSQVEGTQHKIEIQLDYSIEETHETQSWYFIVEKRPEGQKIINIYDDFDLAMVNSLKTLKSYPEYEYEAFEKFRGFTYMDASDPNLVKLIFFRYCTETIEHYVSRIN